MLEKARFLLKDKTNRLILVGLLIAGLAMLLMPGPTAKSGTSENPSEAFTADTIIPAGFVLVPIEIQNIDSLSSMIGQFGVIDLFTTMGPNQKPGLRVGRRLKLLRAPLNPQQFAVLVPENESTELLQASGPFTAVIQNPSEAGKSEVMARAQAAPHIEYFKGVRR